MRYAIVQIRLAGYALRSALCACWAGLLARHAPGWGAPAQLLPARAAPLQPQLGPRCATLPAPTEDQAGWPLRELESLLSACPPGESGARLLMAEFVSG